MSMRPGFKLALVLLILLPSLEKAGLSLTRFNRWQTYTSQDGGYSVELPGKPHEEIRRVPGPTTSVLMRYVATQAPDRSGVFGVAYLDLPPAIQDPRAAAAQMECTPQRLKGQLLSKYDVNVQGYRGREYKVQREQGVTTVRTLLVGRRIYELIVNAPSQNEGGEVRERFLSSFKLLARS
jgi:hypothetical protein